MSAVAPTVNGNGNGIMTISSVRQAAEAAAEVYEANEIDKHAAALIDAWSLKLKEQTRSYVKQATLMARSARQEIAGPINPSTPLYPYWGLFMAGPFQPLGGANGPFLPHKIIKAGEPAFMLYALWRNPGCMNWLCPAPSACELMSGWDAQIWMRTGNLTNWTPGQAFGPYNIKLGNYSSCSEFGYVPLNFPTPPNGQPDLYEINATVDITGPGAVSFAGFSTWAYDPDFDALSPFLSTTPHWQFETPMRFMVYTA